VLGNPCGHVNGIPKQISILSKATSVIDADSKLQTVPLGELFIHAAQFAL
jgi:hypothetical protein